MDTPLLLEILAIVGLIFANGFFALSEFSIIASRKSKLRQKAEADLPGAAAAEKLHNQPDRFLATIQVGITAMATLAGVIGGATIVTEVRASISQLPVPWIAKAAPWLSVGFVAVAITIFSVIIGELVPKYIALSYPERWARWVARPISVFIALTSIFSRGLSAISNLIVRAIGVRSATDRPAITEEEINLMIHEGEQKGIFDDTEARLIKSVFEFADSTVRRAMTPRTDVVGIPITATMEQIYDINTANGYSRYPIFDDSLDKIVGVLYVKDMLLHQFTPELIILKDLIRKVPFVPDSMPLSKLLSEFQRLKNHMAIVLDDYGGTAGIITLEDILEELVGEIQDEYDEETAPLIKHSDTVAFADASVWPGAVNEMLGSHLPEENADTLTGLILEHLGRLPGDDKTVTIDDVEITILNRRGTRLLRLKLEKLAHNGNNGTNNLES